MSESNVLNVWTWHGRIGRQPYLLTGLILFALKHNIDRVMATAFEYPWGPFNYFVFYSTSGNGIWHLTYPDASFLALLVLAALPFIWIGVVLTLRRLRDTALPLWLVFLFFVPLINLIFFVILAAVPSDPSTDKS